MKTQIDQWAHLAPHPKSAYKQLFVKGTRIRARVIYGLYAMAEDALTPDQIAAAKHEIWSLDSQSPLNRIESMDELLALSLAERRNHLPLLLKLYRDDPDPGSHGALDWLLRKWHASEDKKEIDKELATGKVVGNRQWYLNRQGQTMVVVVERGSFWMGGGDERQRRRIDRSFAIASKEATVEEFLRFRREHQYSTHYASTDDCPANNVTWFDAAAYCNWLSEQDGLTSEEWCYVPNQDGKYAEGMTMAPDYLKRIGYRLPTEAEWECACRAGADTVFAFGEAAELLGKYAWFDANSLGRSHPVGMLRPNDLGLFDMHGNNWEWCQDSYQRFAKMADHKAVLWKWYLDYIGIFPKTADHFAIADAEQDAAIDPNANRALRGNAFDGIGSAVQSAFRHFSLPSVRSGTVGFRPARTYRDSR